MDVGGDAGARPAEERAAALHASLLELVGAVDGEAARQHAKVDAVLAKHRASALNLAHYLGLRRQDVRRLQLELAALGLSSLGRCEGHVRDTLSRLCAWLSDERARAMTVGAGEPLDWSRAEKILHANTRALFGPKPRDRHVYIMVTAPEPADASPEWAEELLRAGADLLRINGAHDSPDEWRAIATVFKGEARRLDRPGRIFVDLPGPKLRAEIRQAANPVLHLPRSKDNFGRTLSPTEVLLVAEQRGEMQIPVPAHWPSRLEAGDVLEFVDSAGRDRSLTVVRREQGGALAQCERSLYVTRGLALAWRRGKKEIERGVVGPIAAQRTVLALDRGDCLLLNASGQSDAAAVPALAIPEPQLLAQVRAGERVILDDGRLIAIVEKADAGGLLCRVQHAVKSPTRLRSGKGIAFPDSNLSLQRLGPQDELALAFALEHANGVGVSFVNSARDVALIGGRLQEAEKPGFGMVLKLETRGAMRNLPAILFEALKHDPVGLMIARGDLAVELSFEKLAEMQEELLWFGEASHLPVIWATQVLDSAAHSGLPTRAEITDAAMSMRAECVMLNKGPYVGVATRMLADIIRKMETHQYKKRSLYRPLTIARTAN